jgi:hypothetical protein
MISTDGSCNLIPQICPLHSPQWCGYSLTKCYPKRIFILLIMDAIRIKNLRALEDTGLIDLKPITFLLGANSSGKSTFLRSLPLIRQSVTAKTTSPILWYGDLVDFGGFKEALNNKSNIKEICFSYKFKISNDPSSARMHRLFYSMVRVAEDLNVSIEIRMAMDESQYSSTVCKGLTIKIADHIIEIEIDNSGLLTKFDVNSTSFLRNDAHFKSIQEGGLLPQIFRTEGVSKEVDPSFYAATFSRSLFFTEDLIKLTKKIAHNRTSIDNIVNLAQSLILGSSSTIAVLSHNSIYDTIIFNG